MRNECPVTYPTIATWVDLFWSSTNVDSAYRDDHHADVDLGLLGCDALAYRQDPSQEGYDDAASLRRCRGIVTTTAGDDAVVYTIGWEDEAAQRFQIEARLAK